MNHPRIVPLQLVDAAVQRRVTGEAWHERCVVLVLLLVLLLVLVTVLVLVLVLVLIFFRQDPTFSNSALIP